MALSPEELVAVASLGGAAIGALPGIIAAVFNRRSEDKRHFNELVFNAATESWKLVAEKAHLVALLPLSTTSFTPPRCVSSRSLEKRSLQNLRLNG